MENSIYAEFGKRLAALRQEKDISQFEVAKALGIAQTTYSGYENGARKIPLELIEKLSNYFEVSPTYLITGKLPDSSRFTPHEQAVLCAYKEQPKTVQDAVDRLLGVKYREHNQDNMEAAAEVGKLAEQDVQDLIKSDDKA